MKNKVIAFITSKTTFKQTQKEKIHSHSRWLECVQNNKTAWITPTNDEAKLKLSNRMSQQWNSYDNNKIRKKTTTSKQAMF